MADAKSPAPTKTWLKLVLRPLTPNEQTNCEILIDKFMNG